MIIGRQTFILNEAVVVVYVVVVGAGEEKAPAIREDTILLHFMMSSTQ